MKKLFKRVLSFLMVLAMVMTMIPALPARAEELEYTVQINMDGASCEVVWDNGDEEKYPTFSEYTEYGKAGETIAEVWGDGIKSLTDPVFWDKNREFSGWLVYKELEDGDRELLVEEPISTSAMLEYPIPEYNILIIAKWADSDLNYYTNVIFDGWQRAINFTEDRDGDENDDCYDTSYHQYTLQRHEGVSIVDQIENEMKADFSIVIPESEEAEFEGWLKFKISAWEEDGAKHSRDELVEETFENPMTMEAVLNDKLPTGTEDVRYVAKWTGITKEEYKEQYRQFVDLNFNGGSCDIKYQDGTQETGRTDSIYGNVNRKKYVKDVLEISELGIPKYWTDREFQGWTLQEGSYDSESEGVNWVDVEGVFSTDELLSYKIAGNSLSFSAKWSGNDYDYIGDLEFDAYSNENEASFVVNCENDSYNTNFLRVPMRLTDSETVKDQLERDGYLGIKDPVRVDGTLFQGWLKAYYDRIDNGCYTISLSDDTTYTTEEVLAATWTEGSEGVRYIAKWEDIDFEEYEESLGGGNGNDDGEYEEIVINYCYFDEWGDTYEESSCFEYDGESTFADLCEQIEATEKAHYEGLGFIEWEYDENIVFSEVAKPGYYYNFAKYDKALVKVFGYYYDELGEATYHVENVVVDHDATYADVRDKVTLPEEEAHCAEYGFTGEWRPDQSYEDTVASGEILEFEAVYDKQPARFIYTYQKNDIVYEKEVNTLVDGRQPTLKLLEKNIPSVIDTTNITTWRINPQYMFGDWLSPSNDTVWVSAQYKDQSPVNASIVNIEYNSKNKLYEVKETDKILYAAGTYPENADFDPDNLDVFDENVNKKAYEIDNKQSNKLKLMEYAIYNRNLENKDLVYGEKGDDLYSYTLKYDYKASVEYYVKAIYNQSLLIIQNSNSNTTQKLVDTGSTYKLSDTYNDREIRWWDREGAFYGGDVYFGGDEIVVDAPYTKCIAGYDECEDDHEWGAWEVLQKSTCLYEGFKKRTCEYCNWDEYEDLAIDSTNHEWNEENLTKAKYKKDGSITYSCGYGCGKTKKETIPQIKSIALDDDTFTYDGGTHTPKAVVKDSKGKTLKKGTDYDLSYKTIKSVGEYKVTVKFKGNYSGETSLKAYVVPKKPTSVGVKLAGYNDVTVSWKKSTGATGYYVYYKSSSASSYSKKYVKATSKSTLSYTLKDLSSGKKYSVKVRACFKDSSGDYRYSSYSSTETIYTLKKISTPTVKKSGSKVKVTWKNIAGETGYQISKSTSKSGTKIVATYKTTSGKSKTLSATKGKKYYYKVRAYKEVSGKKIYGPWSSVKAYKR